MGTFQHKGLLDPLGPLAAPYAQFGVPRFAFLLSAPWTRLVVWAARRRERMMLSRLNERMLHDIGLTTHDVDAECRKPFWQP